MHKIDHFYRDVSCLSDNPYVFIICRVFIRAKVYRKSELRIICNKLTKNASKNQDLWNQELSKISVTKGFKLALDGHFCLLDPKGR